MMCFGLRVKGNFSLVILSLQNKKITLNITLVIN